MGTMDQISKSNTSWTTVTTEATHSPLHRYSGVHPEGQSSLSSQPTWFPATAESETYVPAQAGKQRVYNMEIESVPSEQSWMRRIKWLRNPQTHRGGSSFSPTRSDDVQYVGGTMDTTTPMPLPHKERQGSSSPQREGKQFTMTTFERIASWMTANSSQHDEDDVVVDFHQSEWTPPDSSYGAALPVFGWIPKNTRRYIEYTIYVLMIFGLVYLVVMLAMRISEARQDAVAADSGLGLNDDRYIEYNSGNDDDGNEAEETDDDAYWNGDDGQRYR